MGAAFDTPSLASRSAWTSGRAVSLSSFPCPRASAKSKSSSFPLRASAHRFEEGSPGSLWTLGLASFVSDRAVKKKKRIWGAGEGGGALEGDD